MNRRNRPVAIDRGASDPAAGDMVIRAIAHIRTEFPEKFGIPRQSGLVQEVTGKIVFVPDFRSPQAVRGLERFSHLWLLWQFSEALRDYWTPMVRPPRLGGDTYMGVYATRSPFRPNPIGLSCVTLEKIAEDPGEGPVLYVGGADLMDGTPIYDIKPYLPYTDARPEASGGFADGLTGHRLEVVFPEEELRKFPEEKLPALRGILAQDPRPGFQQDPERVYGVTFAGYNIRFRVEGKILTVLEACPADR